MHLLWSQKVFGDLECLYKCHLHEIFAKYQTKSLGSEFLKEINTIILQTKMTVKTFYMLQMSFYLTLIIRNEQKISRLG